MQPTNVKQAARHLIEELPENCTWEDLMNRIYVQVTIEAGLADSLAGRLTAVEAVRKQFGLPE